MRYNPGFVMQEVNKSQLQTEFQQFSRYDWPSQLFFVELLLMFRHVLSLQLWSPTLGA